MKNHFGYIADGAVKALEFPDYYVWDCSVIYAQGQYHMFSSRWKRELGFGSNWLFNAEVVHCVADRPEGPYHYCNTVLPRRGRQYFDGMNTHNTCIKYYDGKYYLFYMGCTYRTEIPKSYLEIPKDLALETWNRKRIGLAVAEDINADFIRGDKPLLEPRDCSHWDCTVTTNPTVAILPGGKTYMIYKSRRAVNKPLQLGMAVAEHPAGPFERLTEGPILQFEDENLFIEDPFLWYDEKRKKFCAIIKDDCRNGSSGITGEWGSGFYAESDDAIHFEIPEDPKVYSSKVKWADGTQANLCNLERPSLLFDENGEPTHLFCSSGVGPGPFAFEGSTFVVCLKLKKKEDEPALYLLGNEHPVAE